MQPAESVILIRAGETWIKSVWDKGPPQYTELEIQGERAGKDRNRFLEFTAVFALLSSTKDGLYNGTEKW